MELYYEVMGNSDQTEGRGRMEAKRYYLEEDDAVEYASSPIGASECAVMGVGAGEVVKVKVQALGGSNSRAVMSRETVWGHRKDPAGNWGYGYVDNRDAPVNDPEYADWVRLNKKFGGS